MTIYKYIINQKSVRFLYFIILVLLFRQTYSQVRYNIVNPQGIRTVHYAEVLNDISYLPVSQLSPVLFPKGRYEESKGEIKFKDGIIRITPLSFYIVFDDGKSIKAGQMNTPAIIKNSQLLVPAISFFKCLETLDVFTIIQKNETFYFSNKSDINLTAELAEPETTGDKELQESPAFKFVGQDKSKRFIEINFKKYFNESSEKLKKGFLAIKSLNDKVKMSYEVEEQIRTPLNPPLRKGEVETPLNPPLRKGEREEKPVYKGDVKPVDKKYPPNLYVLPQNLIRKELEEKIEDDTLNKNDFNENLILNNDLFASLSLYSLYSLPQIIKITTESTNDTLIIHLIADGFIESYQAPDCAGKNLTLRIKNVVNSIENFDDLKEIQSVKAETIHDLLVYRIKTEFNIISCNSRRNGSKEIIYTLILDKPKDNNKKNIETENKNADEDKPALTGFENEKRKWALDVIVLDPGHGGHDPGAISINGYKEKDFTLKIAKKVKELITENKPETKVIMTREDDTFIELFNRRDIANKNKGKLFISIHLNSSPTKPGAANGFETYILRPGRNDDAINVARRENAVIKLEKKAEKYKALTEEELIIATMAQSVFVKFSELFAKILQSEVEKTTPMKNRGVNQAGFYVLVGASMPNILFEVAFLSNQENEDYINTEKGIEEVADGIYNAIARYAREYEKICK